jgi:hypothetical protein
MYNVLVSDAKESIRDILSKQPKHRVIVDMWVIVNYDEKAYTEYVTGIQLKDGMIELLLPDDDIVRSKDVLNSEWLYILECVEFALAEKEGRL